MFARLFATTPKITINNTDIKNLDVDTIDKLKQSPHNKFQLTNMAMHDAYTENNIDKLKYLNNNFGLRLPTLGCYHVDVSIEEGNDNMAKFLVTDFKCAPSLYAKQMSQINGHTDLVTWVDANSIQRNDIGIQNIHGRYDLKTKQWRWDSWVPEQFRVFQ